MSDGTVNAQTHGPVGHLIFDNPARHNAVSLAMWESAARILREFRDSAAIRVVVLSGAGGKAFVSGADISKFDSERAETEAVAHYNATTQRVYEAIESLPKPTIAMIDGYCLGGGLNLALACDVRLCSAKSRFGLPAARLGLGYPDASLKRLIDAVGPGHAKDIAFSARQFGADEALAIDLVQRVVADGELGAAVEAYSAEIAANAPLTLKAMKLTVAELLKDAQARNLALCQRLVADCFASEDYREGRRAFLEKRKPRFQGC
ncbi:MAG: enoyl-CoA hydratase [Gammaproteobacteria bacterium]